MDTKVTGLEQNMGKLIMREEVDNMKQDLKDGTVKPIFSGHSKRPNIGFSRPIIA